MARPLLPGWSRAAGSGRRERYVSPTGEEVSRRQYENARAREAGFQSWSHYQRIAGARRHGARRYQRFASIYADKTGQSLKRVRGPSSDFTGMYFATDFNDVSPDGSLSHFLVKMGLREPETSYPVGSSPRPS